MAAYVPGLGTKLDSEFADGTVKRAFYTAYNSFLDGISATNMNHDAHVTAIGHSYGSRLVGAATQEAAGIPGAGDVILVGSPGVGVDRDEELGVGKNHVWVGAAENDIATKLLSKNEALTGAAGFFAGGPGGAYIAGGVAPTDFRLFPDPS
ncbi:alpha/beta hydrolase [Streptomyces sp. NPDC127039]|uniref:alpha/beta hydrolase n=1 Tax=Streptomyces sp. NPDC127039 TaxID=3347115 RepID=UPI003656DFB0